MQRFHLGLQPTGRLSGYWEEGAAVEAGQKAIELDLASIFERDSEHALLKLGMLPELPMFTVSLKYWHTVASSFTAMLEREPQAREGLTVNFTLDENQLRRWIFQVPPMPGAEYLNTETFQGIWNGLARAFRVILKSHAGNFDATIRSLSSRKQVPDKIHFHLIDTKTEDGLPFAFVATYAREVAGNDSLQQVPLSQALVEFKSEPLRLAMLLSTVRNLAAEIPLLENLLATRALFKPVMLDVHRAYEFLQAVPIIEKAGVLCRIPRWWKPSGLSIRAGLTVGSKPGTGLGLEQLLDVDASLFVDGERITIAEAKRILSIAKPLILLKGRWVSVNQETLQKSLVLMEQAKKLAGKGGVSFREALSLLMGAKGVNKSIESLELEVEPGAWLSALWEKMKNPRLLTSVIPGKGFRANLRPYQQEGANWLGFLCGLGFGACLADDMGLGKTVQVLAYLESLRSKKSTATPHLLIVPTSLLTNWRAEVQRFAPELKILIAHNQFVKLQSLKAFDLKKLDLVITSYGMLGRFPLLEKMTWNHLILDEAQAIKNSGTRQSKAVKKLKALQKIALSGTPVENRLSDLWSMFDFLNPGLLGSATQFTTFTNDLDTQPQGYEHLRAVVGPYILRRLKTDKKIINDLPDKVEQTVHAHLTKTQQILYKNCVEELAEKIAKVEPIKRRGLVLPYITKLKQICNHPDHYTGNGAYHEDQSGKFQLLREICEVIREKRERVLVFTQYREILPALNSFLKGIFAAEGVSLSGETTPKERLNRVNKFQGEAYVPYFLLTVKAGGIGLNLTAASHVIHFDRWWNPAVENQATDRAFRIGQHRNVMVHKFLCPGTLEEKIDLILQGKTELAGEIIQSDNGNWMSKMDNKSLLEVFSLNLGGD